MNATTIGKAYLTDNHFKLLIQANKNKNIKAKRKLTDLIIDELDEEEVEESKRKSIEKEDTMLLQTKQSAFLLTHLQSPDISVADSQDEMARPSKKTNKRLNLDMKRSLINSLLDQTLSPRPAPISPIKQPDMNILKIQNVNELLIETNLIESPKLDAKTVKNLTKSKLINQQSYDIDAILGDPTQINDPVTPKKALFNINKASDRDKFLLDEIDNELAQSVCDNNRNLEKLSASASSLSLDDSGHEINENISSKNIPFKSYRAVQESLIDENFNESLNATNNLNEIEIEQVMDEELVNNRTDKNLCNITGIEWLKEKLINDDTLNKTGLDCTSLVGNSSLFLTDNDLKKKKVKYVKNGYAERLQKILLRQSSSVNFIRHHMNKEKSQKFKDIKNAIIAYPFYRQSSFHKQFSLIYALNVVESNEQEPCEKYIYILVSNEMLESLKAFNEDNEASNLIKIYPPWRRMILKDSKLTIYFCTNLIEMIPFDEEAEKISSDICIVNKAVFTLNGIKCPECNNENSYDCKLQLFDVKSYLTDLKMTISKERLQSKRYPNKELTTTATAAAGSTQNYLFYTQTDAGYYVNQNAINSSVDSQYMKVNSILDALENIGYYGFVTFRATVQRIGTIKNASFQSTNSTQITQQSTQLFKRNLIVSDRFGMFALIIMPVEIESIEEGQKYQFNSLKFLEKLVLSPRENSTIYIQISFLWEQMNQKRKSDSKSSLKTSPKSIYVLEYTNETGRSWLEHVEASKSFVPLKSFDSLSSAYEEINEYNVLLFNLIGALPLKLQKKQNGYYELYFLSKSSNDEDYTLKKIQLDYMDNFLNTTILKKLTTNTVPVECFLTLKNIEMNKCTKSVASNFLEFKGYDLNSNCFTGVEIRAENFENKLQSIATIQHSIFKNVTDPNLNLFDFVKITGKVMDICEENCCFELNCYKCQYDLNSSRNSDDEISKSKLICDACGHTNDKPEINLQMQLILNCIDTSLLVKVYLHEHTISEILPIDSILQNGEAFDASLVLDKKIGPLYAFVTNLSDTEICTEELFFS